jgi:hypothetical protein
MTSTEMSIYLPFSEFQNGKYDEMFGQQYPFLCQDGQNQ